MNQTLESMARAIFRSWFVDFDPVVAKAEGRQPFGMSADVAALFPSALIRSQAGQIPSGWSTVNVGSVTEIKRQGINPGEFPNESFDHYSIPAFDESRMPKRESGASIKSNKFIVPPQTVLLSKLNPRFPRVWLPEIDSIHRPVCSTEFIVSEPKPGVSREFMYCLFGSLAFAESFSGLVTGTSGSHQRVKPEDLLHMKVIQPPQALTAHFAQLVGPMLKRNSALTEESITLSRMRDTLLPKLMSGELRIRDAEKLVGTHV
jgi:type I restriction enzyme S subunit